MHHPPRAVRRGALVAVGFAAVTAVATGLVPNPLFDRFVPRSGVDAGFLVGTAALLGVYTTQQSARTDCTRSAPGVVGGVGGSLAVSCPHCLPLLAGTLSTPVIAVYVVPIRPAFGVAAFAIVAAAIVARERRLVTAGPATAETELRCPTCGASLRRWSERPTPDVAENRMRIDMACPGCDDDLVVFVEAVVSDEVAVRKRVVRRAEADAEGVSRGSRGPPR